MAPQTSTRNEQNESDHVEVSDKENDEQFAPNWEIGDGLGVWDGASSDSDDQTPTGEGQFDYRPLRMVHEQRDSRRATTASSCGRGVQGGHNKGLGGGVHRPAPSCCIDGVRSGQIRGVGGGLLRMQHSRRRATIGVSVFTNPVSSHDAPSTQSVEDITDLADPVNMNTHPAVLKDLESKH